MTMLHGGVDQQYDSYYDNPNFNGSNGRIGTLAGGVGRLAGAVGSVIDSARGPGLSVGGYGAPPSITQNTSYFQPYTNVNPMTPVQFMSLEQMAMQPMTPLAPMSPLGSPLLQGAAQAQGPAMIDVPSAGPQFVAAGGQGQPLPPGVQEAINAAQGPFGRGNSVINAQDSGQGMGQQGPLLQPNQGPQQQPMVANAPPMQQAPQQVAAPAMPMSPPAPDITPEPQAEFQQPGGLGGQEDPAEELRRLREENLRFKTMQMQGAPSQMPAQAKPQPQQPAAPQGVRRPNPFLMMMSPKLTDAYLNIRTAEAKGRAEAAKMKADHEFDMEKQREHDEYVNDREDQRQSLKQQMEGKMTAAQQHTAERDFWRAEPDSDERWFIASQLPHLRNSISRPQDKEAALESQGKALSNIRQGIQNAIDANTIDQQIAQKMNDAEKSGYETRGAQLDTSFKDRTYEWRAQQEEGRKKQLWQNIQQAAAENPMKLHQMALDQIAKAQAININDSDEKRKAFQDTKALFDSYVTASGMLVKQHPARPYIDAALKELSTALGTGQQEIVKTPDGRTKTVTKVDGDMTAMGAINKQNVQRILQGGVHHTGQGVNGLIPPPPPGTIAPSIIPAGGIPMNFAGMPPQGPPQFGPNGLAQAPPAVPAAPSQFQQPQVQQQMPQASAPQQQAQTKPQVIAPMAQVAPQGAPLTDVQRSIKAGRWVGTQEPTTAEQLQMLPHILGGALAGAVKEGVAALPGQVARALDAANDKAWQDEKKKALAPFVTPQSRGLAKGAPLTDPELVSYFARVSGTQARYNDVIKAAGWTPVETLGELREVSQPQPITSLAVVRQAFDSGHQDFLTPSQRAQMEEEISQGRKQRFLNTSSGKVGFNLFPAPPPPRRIARGR